MTEKKNICSERMVKTLTFALVKMQSFLHYTCQGCIFRLLLSFQRSTRYFFYKILTLELESLRLMNLSCFRSPTELLRFGELCKTFAWRKLKNENNKKYFLLAFKSTGFHHRLLSSDIPTYTVY